MATVRQLVGAAQAVDRGHRVRVDHPISADSAVLQRYLADMAQKQVCIRMDEEAAEVAGRAAAAQEISLSEYVEGLIRSDNALPPTAAERQRERDRLGELVAWMEEEHGPATEEEMAAAEAERREMDQWFGDREADTRGCSAGT